MRRKTNERGAALFVIVLVVSLLTAIGVFAMHATSLAQLGSGYSRRSATAQYLAEFAGNLRIATIADTVDDYVAIGWGKKRNTALPRAQQNDCLATKDQVALYTPGDMPFCVPYSGTLLANDAKASNSSLGSDPEGFYGALNRPDAPLGQLVAATVRVESTDHTPSPRPLAGFATSGSSTTQNGNYQDTMFITATIQPAAAVSDMCTAPVTRASETQRVTSVVIYAKP